MRAAHTNANTVKFTCRAFYICTLKNEFPIETNEQYRITQRKQNTEIRWGGLGGDGITLLKILNYIPDCSFSRGRMCKSREQVIQYSHRYK